MNQLIEKTYAALPTLGDFFKSYNLSGTDPSKMLDMTWGLRGIEKLIQWVMGFALDFGGVLAVIMILYGAVQYATAYGDDAKAETAKKTIMWSIIGLFVLVLARTIVIIVGGYILKDKSLLSF
jgi:hypothetical protein